MLNVSGPSSYLAFVSKSLRRKSEASALHQMVCSYEVQQIFFRMEAQIQMVAAGFPTTFSKRVIALRGFLTLAAVLQVQQTMPDHIWAAQNVGITHPRWGWGIPPTLLGQNVTLVAWSKP